MLLWMLLACERLKGADELTKPVVMQGLYLGLDIDPEWAKYLGKGDEDQGAFAYTAVCDVFVAYLSGTGSLEDSPVSGADVSFDSDANKKALEFDEQSRGKYVLDSTQGLNYEPDDSVEVGTEVEGTNALAGRTPAAPDLSVTTSLSLEEDLDIDLTGTDYDNIIVGVYYLDLLNGGKQQKLTYDNLPTEFLDVYDFTHPTRPVRSLTIPGDEAFPKSGTYILGVAGMEIAPTQRFEGVNTTLSAFMSGQMTLRVVSVSN